MLSAKRWVLAFLVSLLALQFSIAADLDLGEYSITNPKFTVTYSKPVKLDVRELKTADLSTTFNICTNPNPTGYVEQYTLYTRTSVADGACNTVQSQALVPGEYRLRLRASDQSGKVTEDFRQFRIYGINISQVEPESRVSPSRPPSVEFITTKRAPEVVGFDPPAPEETATYCRYATELPGGKTWTQTTFNDLAGRASNGQKLSRHRITLDIFPATSKDVYIICKEEELRGQESKEILKLQYDLTPPRFLELDREPARITMLTGGKGLTNINIETDDATACNISNSTHTQMLPGESFTNYNTYTRSHFTQLEFDPSMGAAERNFSYSISCWNLAGHKNTTTFNVTVDFRNVVLLELYEPGELVTTPEIDLVIKPTYLADPSRLPLDDCYVNDDGSKRAANRMSEDTRIDAVSEFPVFVAPFSLNEGKNQFKIQCYGEKTANGAWNITLDSRSPSAPTINVSPILCEENLTVEFNSTDRGLGIIGFNYTIQNGEDTIKGVTQKRVSFKPADTVTINVFAVDAAGNIGDDNTITISPEEGTNEECGLPPFIRMRSPGMGYAPRAPYTVEIETYAAAQCRYALAPGYGWEASLLLASSEANRVHSKEFSFNQRELHVICNETAKNRMHRQMFMIGVDNTAPRLSPQDFNNPITDSANKVVLLTVKTDDLTYCYLDGEPITQGRDDVQSSYKTEHSTTIDMRSVTSLERQVEEYTLSCTNLAELGNSTPYEVIIHLGARLDIDILSPSQFTADDEVILSAKPSKQADCTWRFAGGEEQEFDTSAGNIHNVSLGELDERGYQAIISCTGVGDEGTQVWDFTIERTAPEISDLNGPTLLCEPSQYTFNVSGLDNNPTISYSIADIERNITDELIELDPAQIEPGSQTLAVKAYNRAGVEGETATFDIEIATDEICLAPADHCTNGELDEGEQGIDCGGTCAACEVCADDLQCGTNQECIDGVCVDSGCTTSNDCDLGEICSAGVCQAPGCQQSCGLGTICDVNSGKCVETIDCNNCPSGTACNDQGVCIATPGCTQCGDNTVCVNDLCVGLLSCGTCPSGLSCGSSGFCSPAGTCASSLDCDEPLVCTGNSLCAAVQECSFTADCASGFFCNSGYCAQGVVCNPGLSCAEQDQVCSNDGFCTAAVGCDLNNPCTSGYVCRAGVCIIDDTPTGCIDDFECGSGNVCVAGTCENVDSGPADECIYDDDCADGGLCIAGVCQYDSGPTPEPEDGGSLLSILLIFFGIGIMGGAGYFLYQQNLDKQTAKRSAIQQAAQNQPRRPVGQLSPRMAQAYEQNKEQRQAALQAEYERRQAEKTKRESAFQSFGGKPETKTEAKTETKEPQGDDYVDLSTVKGKPKKKDDAFDELERLGK